MAKHYQQTNPQPLAWREANSAKKYDLHDEKQHDQHEGAFRHRNMKRSQQTWVKMFMEDVMDEKGQVLFVSSIRHVLEYSSIGYIYARYIYTVWSASMHSG
jgi:hypothetical protein